MIYFILSLIPITLFTICKTKKSLHMLQQNWYNDGHRYLKWIIDNPYKVFIAPDMGFVIFLIGVFVPVSTLMLSFTIFYTVAFFLYYHSQKREQVKKPLVFTKRVRRLSVTTTVLYLIAILPMLFFFSESIVVYSYLLLGALVYFNDFVVLLANEINVPWEKGVFYYYKKKASKKLKSMPNLEVIGITGSYGKTSSKNIVSDILNVKFNALPTPKNFNTTYGLIRTINETLDKFSDLFIAEMGAFKRGEIKELCNFVKPKYGILTKIGTAHLDSFGSEQNIQKGKFELIESLPKDGVAILNGDDMLQVTYPLKNNCETLWIGIENKDVDLYATNINLTKNGTTFDCVFKGDTTLYPFSMSLLGVANIYNVLAGILLGKRLGMNIEQLQLGVLKIKPIEHRLELKEYQNIHLIDDAYNSNPVGSKMALEVLNLMPGKKMIVTPGMIELSDRQYELNLEFGKQIAEVCDEVILVGKEQTKPIQDGLRIQKYPEKNIHIINDVKEAFVLMQQLQGKETYVLIENDLPDIFNEK